MPHKPRTHRPFPQAKRTDNRPSAAERGYDATWNRLRKEKLAENPLCEVCEAKGLITPATEVHHIKPVRDYPELRLDMNNLMSTCTPCHDEIEPQRKWGKREQVV